MFHRKSSSEQQADLDREPTEFERNETIADAKEHRYMHNELTMQDYKDKYNGKQFKLY